MSIIIPANTLAGGFNVDNSCRFDRASSSAMSKSSLSGGSNTIGTVSVWLKRSGIGTDQRYWANYAGSDSDRLQFGWQAADKLYIQHGANVKFITTRVFRDVSAWYHVVVAIDSTEADNANRVKVYVNGVRETAFDTFNTLTEDGEIFMNNDKIIIGERQTSDLFYDGYLCEVVQLDGTAAAADSFGEFDEDSGIWKPIDVSGLTFGTNGFYLDFEASGNLGNDANGGGDFTETNLAAIDQTTDTCTNNFATLNPLFGGGVNLTLTEGNLNAEAEDGQPKNRVSTIAVSSGKWYAEFMSTAGTNYPGFGIMDVGSTLQTTVGYLGSTADSYCMFQGGLDYNGGTESDIGTAWGEDVIMGIGIDLDSGTKTIKYYKNGSEIHSRTISTPANGYVFAVTHSHDNTVSESNFGNPITALSSAAADGNGFGAFEFAPPSGYFALCTKNLAEHG